MTDILNVSKLPVRNDLGFPHVVQVNIDGTIYRVFLGFNAEDNSLHTDFTRVKDNKILFLGKIPERTKIIVKDPISGDKLFALWASEIDRAKGKIDVWIFPQSITTDPEFERVLGGT